MQARRLGSVVTGIGVLTLAWVAYAQQAPSSRDTVSQADQQLTWWVYNANQMEIDLALAAQEKGHNQEVKDFANRLIEDHAKFLKKLDDIGLPKPSIELVQREARRPIRPDAQAVPRISGEFRLMEVKDQLDEKLAETFKKALAEKEGNQFDTAFLTLMIVSHMQMKDTLSVFEKHVSPEVAQVFAEGRTTTEQHLDQATKLLREVEE